MNVEEQLNQDIEYNRLHPIFPDETDDIFGEHKEGRYQKYMEDETQTDILRIVFDNGNTYDISQEDGTLVFKGIMPRSAFIHRYLQLLIQKFRQQHTLPLSVAGDIMCAESEVSSRPFVRIIINREDGWIGITNFHLDPEYQHRNIGKDFLKAVYSLCHELQFRLLLLDCMPTFYGCMVARGAVVIQEGDHLEIISTTDLDSHH